MNSRVPELRITKLNRASVRWDGDYVLYWMLMSRRVSWNFSLDRAIEWASELHKPLVILDATRCDYPWACDRFHQFVVDGMEDNTKALRNKPVLYLPYVEPELGMVREIFWRLVARACVVVTDDFPAFVIPQMVQRAGEKADVAVEAVDSNGLLPLKAAEATFPTAFAFRRYLQKTLPQHCLTLPKRDPFWRVALPPARLPENLIRSYPSAFGRPISELPISHQVSPVPYRGGTMTARKVWKEFLETKLAGYAEHRNDPTNGGTSGLSPYLHFGHISVHQIFHDLMKAEKWSPNAISAKANERKESWWGVRPPVEAFLDQIVTWRELGFNFCSKREDFDSFKSLPDWAKTTLRMHADDVRPQVYSPAQLESASTHDPLWNAAQTQLVREGRLHNYLRMLWGKKILEWTRSPEEALKTLIDLNNKYAADGRDPNSYTGIFWILGRFDRPWGPERPIFGSVRYMTSKNAARKFSVKKYIEKYTA
ncbi:MAG: deoxyribodipyrimidine photolyase [Pseudomonadota bacterium]